MTSKNPPKQEIVALLEEKSRRKRLRVIDTFFPDTGPFSRDKYAKQVEHLTAGATKRERLFLGANQSGKSLVGCYEVACHLTGTYPAWWKGRRYTRPVRAWVCGDYGKTVRDTLQLKLFGSLQEIGTGLIPGEKIQRVVRATGGVAESVDTAYVTHVTGGTSTVTFKSYEAGRLAFQGDVIDVLLLDEEPPADVYTEALTRTATKADAAVIMTFTPLRGFSDVITSFMPDGVDSPTGDISASRHLTIVAWEDVPHLSEQAKTDLSAAYAEHEKDARTRGTPLLGEGAIYATIPEEHVLCDPFPLPPHWPRVWAFDPGWNQPAGLWGAWDRDTDTVYLYDEYYPLKLAAGTDSTRIHAAEIQTRGGWIPGVIDPSAMGSQQIDGNVILEEYQKQGLDVEPALNAREGGVLMCYRRQENGKLKAFSTLTAWRRERRMYRREKGLIVKKNDHLMDAMRYLVVSGLERAKIKPVKADYKSDREGLPLGWMA